MVVRWVTAVMVCDWGHESLAGCPEGKEARIQESTTSMKRGSYCLDATVPFSQFHYQQRCSGPAKRVNPPFFHLPGIAECKEPIQSFMPLHTRNPNHTIRKGGHISSPESPVVVPSAPEQTPR
ncbi:hypothetical protein F5Y08DRAFT_337530 [Xylaria arbuscula]|nr:hypothetical protein F5Y08DRAFT_337530 [Xylaria arbuscula]